MDKSQDVSSLLAWLDSSPTPVHVVQTAIAQLLSSHFKEQTAFSGDLHTKGFLRQDGSLIAWSLGQPGSPFRIVGAHTDSPNLRIQPQPDISRMGWNQLGIEIYGGVLLNSWLDRDLGIAGRVFSTDGEESLFQYSQPLARVPQLAIHLDREISERGLLLDKFQHTSPLWGTNAPMFLDWLSQITGIGQIASFDAHLFDVTPAAILGVDSSLLASGRLDNQLSCWAAVESMCHIESQYTTIVILNDHEEVGSESVTGAGGPMLENLLAVIDERDDLNRGQRVDRARQSWCLSADNAHAVHPNYIEKHDPRHSPLPNHGIALKLNGNQRYATSPSGAAHIRNIADKQKIELQTFVSRNNMPCGSTIGPITSTRLGIDAIDVGVPQLSMHSARELCGISDAIDLVTLMQGFMKN
jgi:aspartyl aminopeptidase